jgi:uncharacterized protein (DUF427 family)
LEESRKLTDHVDLDGSYALPVSGRLGRPVSAPLLEDLRIPTIDYGSGEIRLDPSPKRVRALVDGCVVIDSGRVLLMREPQHLPVYFFPKQDVRIDLLTPGQSPEEPGAKGRATLWTLQVGERTVEDAMFSYEESPAGCPDLSGLIGMYWSRMDAVFEEDEEVIAHARDPHHRIETLRSSRNVRVVSEGQVLAETNRPVMLLESNLPPRFYIPKLDCRLDVLTPSPTVSTCPYKGHATQYWSAGDVADVAWCYPVPFLECAQIANHLAFFQERVEVYVDGVLMAKAVTAWSRAYQEA